MESVNFDRAAEYYDATRALPADSMDELSGLLAAELAGRQPCLEIGVGTGRIALPLRDHGIRLAGLDISAGMLRRLAVNARDRGPVPLLQADATRQPLAAGSFGGVLAVHVLHLMQDWRVAADEALRVLRPGGVLIAGLQGRGRRPGAGAPHSGAPDGGAPDGGAPGGGEGWGGVPWRGALRESLQRHGLVRVEVGTRDPELVAGYLSGRASARRLDPVPVRRTRTLAEAIARIEQQTFSWTWSYTPDQMRAVADDIRAWARREDMPLDQGYTVESELQWWAFDV
ncbi:MAG TPA: class I SAM-dependent methyltransferase [Trebonia sp.]|nr:class I SAM-dependent methyltransferase [Trebonia sp.]